MKLLKFYADWCGPCKMLSRVMEDVELPYPVEEINIDKQQDLAIQYGIRGVPTLILVDEESKEVRRVSGMLMESQLNAFVNKD
jgi:thioredoxin 1